MKNEWLGRDEGVDFSERIIGDNRQSRNAHKDESVLILKIERQESCPIFGISRTPIRINSLDAAPLCSVWGAEWGSINYSTGVLGYLEAIRAFWESVVYNGSTKGHGKAHRFDSVFTPRIQPTIF